MPLLSIEQRVALINYQYRGGDSSILYKYVLSPLATCMVDLFVPNWVAPNVITLLGLLCTVLAAITTLALNPSLSQSEPRFIFLLSGICLFLYQTLDNMDGKQARKTGSSSSLGMLFDHSCDAINTVVAAIPMSAVLGTGWTLDIFYCLFMGFVAFHLQTWEEYYTGSMVLPIFNGASDGLIIGVLICLISYIYGPGIWHKEQVFDIELGIISISSPFDALKAFSGLVAAYTILTHIARVYLATTSTATTDIRGPRGVFGRALLDLLPFVFSFSSGFVWCASSRVALQSYPLLAILLMGSVFVDITCCLIIDHLSASPSKPWNRVMAWTSALPAVLAVASRYSESLPGIASAIKDAEIWSAIIIGFTSLCLTARLLLMAWSEAAEALDIYIFVMGKRRGAAKIKQK